MAIELVRKRILTATEDKTNGARLLAVDNTIRSKSMQECYNAVLQIPSQSEVLLPTAATNLSSIRYLYVECSDALSISIDGAVIAIEPIIANGLAMFEADVNCTEVKIINSTLLNTRAHVFVAGDTA